MTPGSLPFSLPERLGQRYAPLSRLGAGAPSGFGKAPFHGTSLPQTLLAIVRRPAPLLLAHRPSLPAGLDAVVQRCLQKEASQRSQDVGELALDLAPFAPTSRNGAAARVAARLARSSPPSPPSPPA